MIYSGFCFLNLTNQTIEGVGLSTNPEEYEPGLTQMIPQIKDATVIQTIPPTPPINRRIIYFLVESENELDASMIRSNLNYINPLTVSLTLNGAVLTLNEAHEEYEDYESRV